MNREQRRMEKTKKPKAEVPMHGLSIMANGNWRNFMTEKMKALMTKYNAAYSPDWTGQTLGFLLFTTTEKRKGFMEEADGILEFAAMVQIIWVEEQYVKPEDAKEAREEYERLKQEGKIMSFDRKAEAHGNTK